MTNETPPSSVSFWQRDDRRWVLLLLFCSGAVLIVATAGLYSAALPNLRCRNLTGKQLSLAEPSSNVRVGCPGDFTAAGLYQASEGDGIWVVRLPENELVAVHTFCTHDGCATSWVAENRQYGCPCCGSRYEIDGAVLSGPATTALERLKIYNHDGSVLVNRSEKFKYEAGQWSTPGASLTWKND